MCLCVGSQSVTIVEETTVSLVQTWVSKKTGCDRVCARHDDECLLVFALFLLLLLGCCQLHLLDTDVEPSLFLLSAKRDPYDANSRHVPPK